MLNKITLKNKLIFILLCAFAFANAAKGPQYRSLRVNGMGGAFVAVADNKDALYYNPAGLNLINRLGNFEKNPDMGYMPKKSFELYLATVSTSLPADIITDVIDVCGAPTIRDMINKVFSVNFGYFGKADWCPVYQDIIPDDLKYLPDSLKANQSLADSLARFDRLPIEIGTQVSVLQFAMHNFGFSVWTNAAAAPYIDLGVGIPFFGYEPVQVDVTAQTAFAFSPVDNWSVGMGFKMTRRLKEARYDFQPKYEIKFDENGNMEMTGYEDALDSLQNNWENFVDDSLTFGNIMKMKDMGYALDLGVLYQITRTVRLGSSLRNVFFGKLSGESITPNWSIGAMASPMILQSNSWWGRKINFAVDYVDILDGTVTEKFFAHLNFGTEIEQVIIPAVLKLKAGAGYGAGYHAWNLGLAALEDFINLRFGSYAEERGSRTGQKGHRYWTGEVSLGF